MITICSPKTEKEFEAYFKLRWKILREPWDQPPGSEKDDLENGSNHFMAVKNDIIIAVSRLHLEGSTAVIRYMAVDKPYQRQGIGNFLLSHMEEVASQLNVLTIKLNAREKYIQFYLKNGYFDRGAAHTLYNTIKHRKMSKNL